jgi:hypothetical protein
LAIALLFATLAHAQSLLWQKKYAAAIGEYRAILAREANNVEARKGLATAEYWSGNFRSAQRDFRLVLKSRPKDNDAQRSLAEIASASRPVVTAVSDVTSDDQPMHRAVASASYTLFSDPLTKWTATAGTYSLTARSLGYDSVTSPFVQVAGDTKLPALGISVSGSLRALRFPDGTIEPLGGAGITRGPLRLSVEKQELLYTATSLRAHPSATTASLVWTGGDLAALSVDETRYFDGNHGIAANGFHLARINDSFLAGVSAAYRDTDETRFRLIGASASPTTGGYAYSYTAAYDPYWTPRHETEARAIIAASFAAGRSTLRLHADAGIGRDRDLVFGPSSGTTPNALLFPSPIEVSRTFHPWRASADVTFPLRRGGTFTAGIERASTVFYRATTLHLGFTARP